MLNSDDRAVPNSCKRSKHPCRSKTSSSSKEDVKHVLISSVRAVLLWWLPPFDPLYLTSFVLRAIMPNLPYTDQRGGWKLTKLNPAGLYAYEEVRSSFHHNLILLLRRLLAAVHSFHHNAISSCYAAFSQRGISSVNILLSRISAKSTRMSLRITAQSASVFSRGRRSPFFLCS